jgi:hypothetical protein
MAAFAQFQRQTPTFLAKIRRDRRIAIGPGIGPRHALLLGLAVILGEHVDVQRYQPAGQRCDGSPRALQQRHRQLADQRQQVLRLGIQLGAQGRCGGDAAQAQQFRKHAVVAMVLDGVEIRLAGAQQTQIGGHDLAHRQPRSLRESPVQHLTNPRELVQGQPDQRQAGLIGQPFAPLLEFELREGRSGRGRYALRHDTNRVKRKTPLYPTHQHVTLDRPA